MFTARRMVPHRRPLPRRRRRLLLLPRPPWRHDQDRRRQRLAAGGGSGHAGADRRPASRSSSGSTIPSASRSWSRSSSRRPTRPSTSSGLPRRHQDQGVGVQGPAHDRAARARGTPGVVERQARHGATGGGRPWTLTWHRKAHRPVAGAPAGGRDPRHRLRRHRHRTADVRASSTPAAGRSPPASSRAGVGKGTRVALLMPNGVDWAVLAIALARVGAVLVPLSTLLRPPELEAQLRVAGVDHLVFEPSFRGRDYVGDLASIGPLPRLRNADDAGGSRRARRPERSPTRSSTASAVRYDRPTTW